MKNLSDEELISYRDDVREFMIAENEADTRIFQDVSKELVSRLERGRKAIDILEDLTKEITAIMSGEHGIDWADYFGPLFKMTLKSEKLLSEYQQSCKEKEDEQTK